MRLSNPLDNISQALAHSVYEGFDLIEYEDRDWEQYRKTKQDVRIKKSRKHTMSDVDVYAMFPQTWGSTALGFGGIGGQAITRAYTIIVQSNCTGKFCVYFGGKFAYSVDRPNLKFYEDINNRCMIEVKNAYIYEGTSNDSKISNG